MEGLKILRVCLSNELPDEVDRTNQYLYFVYDKLVLLLGKNYYSDPYVIVEKLPTNPISGILYITLNGEVKAFHDQSFIDIATIESTDQIEILKQLGTTFFIQADKRYLDRKRRLLMLPYHNGTYMLTVNLAKDLKINEKTVIRYDPEKEEFYIEGEHEFENFRRYQGAETSTVTTKVEDHCIHADIRLSSDPRNIIKLVGDGLFAGITDKVTNADFVVFKKQYYEYKDMLDGFLADVNEAIENAEIHIGEETIATKIQEAVEEYYGEMVDVFDRYEELATKLDLFEESSTAYTDKVFSETRDELLTLFSEATKDQWGKF